MVSSSHGPAAGGRRRASLSLLRFWKAGVLPRRPAPGPRGARRRRLRARRKPAPLLLEARPGLPALLAAPGGAQGGQAPLLRAPPAGRAERPCRALGRLRVRPAAQQLLGKVGLLCTAAAAGTEQRAESAATVQRDRAAPGCASLSTRSALPGDPPYIFPGRSMNYYGTRGGHDLVFHTELRDALVVSVNDVPEARGGRLHHKPVLGEEQFQAQAAHAPGQSCCQHRNG